MIARAAAAHAGIAAGSGGRKWIAVCALGPTALTITIGGLLAVEPW